MRKVLSFVLVLALVLSSFSMAFAADARTSMSDIAGVATEDAIQVCYDLGIVEGNPDGTFLPEKAVNRAEFAAMITRALGVPDSALAGYTTSKFKDTTGYGWAVKYLAFCESKGIMLGDGAGNAMPGRTINTNESVTMVLRAIGYTANSAELVGVWPSNYVTKAQDLSIYKDVAANVQVDRANAAQILYNTLPVQKVAVNSDGQTTKLWTGGTVNAAADNQVTLLNSGLGCTKEAKSVVTGTEDSLINLNKYFGVYGTAYTNDDGEVVCFIADSTELIGTFSTDGKTFETTVGEVEYTSNSAVMNTALGTEFLNGKTGTVTATDELVLNVKLSGKRIVEIYSTADWKTNSGERIAAADIKDIEQDKSLLGYKFIQDDDKNIDLNSFQLIGVSGLDKISADNVVYVYANADNKIKRIEVGTEVAEGRVTSYKGGTTTSFAIGSKTYKNATDYVNGADSTSADTIDKDDVTTDVKAYLDAKGYVFDFEDLGGGAKNVAVVVKAGGSFGDEVKIFTSAGKEEAHAYDSDKLHVGATVASKGAIIGYGLNKDGKITSANENFVASPAGAGLIFKSNGVVNVDGVDKRIDSDVVVFAEKTDGTYAVSSIDRVKKEEAAATGAVLYKDNTADAKIIGIVVPSNLASASSDDVFAVVNDLYADDLDGDPVDRIVGFSDGSPLDKKADGNYFAAGNAVNAPSYTSAAGVASFAPVPQLFKIDMDASGIIVDVTLVADGGASGDYVVTTGSGATVTAADGKVSVTVTGGEILAFAKDMVAYEINDKDEYVPFTGAFKVGDVVVAYDVDKSEKDGYDVVFVTRAYR